MVGVVWLWGGNYPSLPLPGPQDLNTLWKIMDVDCVGRVEELYVIPCLVGEMSERRKDSVRKVSPLPLPSGG